MINKMLRDLIAEFPLYLNRQEDGTTSNAGIRLFWQKFEYLGQQRKHQESERGSR